jgi:hypothetical protein
VSVLLGIAFFIMAACALASAATGFLMFLGVTEESWPNKYLQRVLLLDAVVWCAIACILILAGAS